jgi:hypothetical protein
MGDERGCGRAPPCIDKELSAPQTVVATGIVASQRVTSGADFVTAISTGSAAFWFTSG